MAGRPKKRIDYAGWSVDMFSNDIKIDKLLDAQGWMGFGIYFYLCQMAFGSEGYYYEWSYDLCASTARKMGGGIGSGTVKETVDYCLKIGLFDKRLFDKWGVLTSRGIQKSYLVVLKSKNRKGTEIYRDYWLLDISKKDEDYQGVVFVRKNNSKLGALGEDNDLLRVNDQRLGEDSDLLAQKDSRGKDRKEKEKKVNTICTESKKSPSVPPVISLILNDKTFYDVFEKDIENWKDLYPAVDIMQELRKMKGWLESNPTKRKTKRGINRFINSWLARTQDSGGTKKTSSYYKGGENYENTRSNHQQDHGRSERSEIEQMWEELYK